MKKIVLVFIVSLSFLATYAQEEDFHKHELKVAIGNSWWLYNGEEYDEIIHFNTSVSYLYRPVKWFWMGANVVNYFGNVLHYTQREYHINNEFYDLEKTKLRYSFVFAPEVRFSYVNRKELTLYSALSGGWLWSNGIDNDYQHYPRQIPYVQVTFFGFTTNFGANNNIFLGGEFGGGHKGLINFHGGYRF
ncbi:MAG: hypothetical protein FWC39_08570 [Bacteroidetes bacterium]|nr:hypothetical protein [Bacteroidota bacterium]